MKWQQITNINKADIDKVSTPAPGATNTNAHCFNKAAATDWSKGTDWADYTVPMVMNSLAKHDYEIFCGGFLLHYDDVVRNAAEDHTVMFKWQVDQTKKTTRVRIRLTPPHKVGTKYKNTKGKFKPNDLLPEYNLSSDPPPPPPPPPPAIW